jgi:hypothetical protein
VEGKEKASLAGLLRRLASAWEESAARWTAIECHCLPCPPVAASEAVLSGTLWNLLERAETQAAREQQPSSIRFETGHNDRTVWMMAARDGTLLRYWRFRRGPLMGAGSPPRKRGRIPCRQAERGRHVRRGDPRAVCVLSADPAMIECLRAVAQELGAEGLWDTESILQARNWLALHPNCGLLAADVREGLWLDSPDGGICIPRPCDYHHVLSEARKIFHHQEEISPLRLRQNG